jgi:hypothetical protein
VWLKRAFASPDPGSFALQVSLLAPLSGPHTISITPLPVRRPGGRQPPCQSCANGQVHHPPLDDVLRHPRACPEQQQQQSPEERQHTAPPAGPQQQVELGAHPAPPAHRLPGTPPASS